MESKTPARPIEFSHAATDCSADVLRVRDRWGVVASARFLDPTWDPARFVGGPLAALLAAIGGRDVERVASAALDVESQVAEIQLKQDGAGHDGTFCVLSSRPLDEAVVRVTVRCVAAALLSQMVEAKVASIAERRGLSERERQVLRLLLRGRALDDIAGALGIAPRTVKFHQSNVLHKLGADSRLDLLRVLL